MDEHVVGFFTKRKPRPLGKIRVPTRGRSYPAIRLYAPFHLWSGRFVADISTFLEIYPFDSRELATLLTPDSARTAVEVALFRVS